MQRYELIPKKQKNERGILCFHRLFVILQSEVITHNQQMVPLVSIAIPAYKKKFLAETIQSVLNQRVQDFELIIVNDKSPEDIDSVVRSFNDERIKYYTNEKNLGGQNPALNWNKCLSYAQGEYFALLCDDDLYDSRFLEQMLEIAEQYPDVNVFRARANFINADGKEINRYASSPSWESWDDYLWHVCRNYRSQTISEWMFRRKALDAVGGYAMLPLAWYADYLSIFRVAKEGGIASVSDILVHFRLSGDNISSQDNKNNIQKIVAANQYREAVAELLKDHADRDNLLDSLDGLLRQHRKYNLKHTPKGTLVKLYLERKKYQVPGKVILKALLKALL